MTDRPDAEVISRSFASIAGIQGVPLRKGTLRTIAAMHHQTNQVVATSLKRCVLPGKYSGGDVIKIKYLVAPGVRNDPNLEPIPRWSAEQTITAIHGA
jgi:hypothetical protein